MDEAFTRPQSIDSNNPLISHDTVAIVSTASRGRNCGCDSGFGGAYDRGRFYFNHCQCTNHPLEKC